VSTRLSDGEARARAARIEALLEQLESADEAARAVAFEALQALMDLYGEALARLVERIAPEAVAGDDVVAHVLLLHGLHPVEVQTRVARAVEDQEKALEPHGASVELLGVADGVARLRMRAGHGCGAMTVRRAIEDAVKQAAPDLDRVEIEVEEPPPPLIPVEAIKLRAPRAAATPA
jgi:Fe-S cluster biogenesis protein NfuA